MKLNTAIVNNYLKGLSPEYRELLEALLRELDNSLSNISPAILGYSKEKALNYISENQYHIIHHLLPRNFFYNNIEIREDVKSAIETLSETDIQKAYSLLLEVTQMPNTYHINRPTTNKQKSNKELNTHPSIS